MIGAKALLIIDNKDEDITEINMFNNFTNEEPKIPGLLLDYKDGLILKNFLEYNN